MSSTVNTTAKTVPQQTAAATQELNQILALGALKPAEQKYLTLAVAQVTADEAGRSREFAQRIRARYLLLLPEKPARKTPTRTRSAGKHNVELVPIGTVDESELNPYAPPNPWALQRIYGDAQLALALKRYSPEKLKEALPAVQERYPGTKPKQMTGPGIIKYIVERLTSTGAASQITSA